MYPPAYVQDRLGSDYQVLPSGGAYVIRIRTHYGSEKQVPPPGPGIFEHTIFGYNVMCYPLSPLAAFFLCSKRPLIITWQALSPV